MSTPANELRAAAAKLRETASRATPGPWRPDPEFSEMVVSPEPTWKGRPTIIASDLEDGRSTWNNVAWVALMSPAVAEPDAALFEVIAEFAEQYDIGGHVDGEPCSDFACRIVHAALASARTILGRTS